MEQLVRLITKRPWWTLALVLLITALAATRIVDPASGELRLQIDPSIERMLPAESEARRFFEEVRSTFGGDRGILVAVVGDELFTVEGLERVRRMSTRFEELADVDRVVSLFTALEIRGKNDVLSIDPFIDEIPEEPQALAQIRDSVRESPVYSGNLISRNGRATTLLVYADEMPDVEFVKSGLDESIAAIAEEEAGDFEIWIAGSPHVRVATSRTLLSDLARILPLNLLVLALIALLSFRSLRGVVVPIATIMIANVWAIAIMVMLGYPLSILTIVVPALIQTIGFAYVIHMVSEHRDLLGQEPEGGQAAPLALRQLALPLVLTAVTTAAGLGALGLSRMVAVREFGILAVIGVVCTLAATAIFAPAALQLGRQRASSSRGEDDFDRIARRLAGFDLQHRRLIFVGAAAVFALSIFGMTRIKVSSDFASNFSPDHPVRSDYENINQNLDGAGLFSVVLQTEEQEAFKEPSSLHTLETIQRWLQDQPEIGSTTSLADYVKVINWGFRGNDPGERRIPESRALVSQLMLVGENDELDQFVDTYFQTANILVRTTVLNSAEVSDLVERIEARLVDLPEGMTGKPTGSLPLLSNTVDEIARGQALSLSVAFIVIYLILSLLFTSTRIGFVALIPNALPVIFYFGLLGLTGVTLNATTGLVACLALGIAVDDTIHYFTRFSREARRLASEEQATFLALRVVGRPVTVTSLALCLGFLVLMISGLRSLVEFGVMTSVTLAFAWLSDVLLTPALCSGLRIVTLWDTLTLDLGKDPTKTIPLFRGLTHRQARIVCLMASIRAFDAGQKVFRKGDLAKEMYVVIDGELKASLSRPTGRIELSPHRRGDALGEVGLYYGKRTADVDAVTDVRALRLTRKSIDRLVRRSPRIGAVVCRNLIDVLADRTASATERIAAL